MMPAPAFAGLSTGSRFDRPPVRRRNATPAEKPFAWVQARGVGTLLVFLLLGVVGLYGAVKGGSYQAFVESEGSIPDLLARAAGFNIEAVTISGQRDLNEAEIPEAAGVSPRNSLLFLDVAAVRQRLLAIPLIKAVSVSKLYPNHLLLDVVERQPYALWQKDGRIAIVAADGTPIDQFRDARFAALPLVVGVDADKRLGDYTALLEAAGDLRPRVRAGSLIAGRRWTLKMTNGVDVLLPETNPREAVATLVQLQRNYRVLDKDVLALDLRQPGRLVVRLTEDAAAARAELLVRKAKKGAS